MLSVVLVGSLLIARQPHDDGVSYDVAKTASRVCFVKIGSGAGSGVIIGEKDGKAYVLSSAHLFKGEGNQPVVEDSDLSISWYRPFQAGEWVSKEKVVNGVAARFVAWDKVSDLALLSFKPKGESWEGLKVPKLKTYFSRKGYVYSVGCEQGFPTIRETKLTGRKLLEYLDGKLNEGIENRFSYHWETKDITQPGRSGGPLISSKGELIGICHGFQGDRGYYTHFLEIHSFLKNHKLDGVVRPD